MSDTENAPIGCFSSIRNQLFCACNLSTERSDCEKQVNLVESSDIKKLNTEKTMKGSVPPGIVARLMGLESMPEPNFVCKARIPDAIRRSRSVSSIDHWSGFDPIQGWHRRIMTSLSFQNMPTLLEIDNNEFLLVSSENVCEKKGIRSKEGKTEKTEMDNNREVKQRRTDRSQNTLNRLDAVVVKKEKKEKQMCSKIVPHQKDCRGNLITARPTQNVAASRKIKHICSVHSQKANDRVCLSTEKMPSELANRTRFHNREKFTKKEQGRYSHCRMEIIKPKPHLPAKDILRQSSSSRIRRKQPLDILKFTNASTDSTNMWNSMNQEAKSSHKCTKSTASLKVRGDVCKLEEEDLKILEWRPREMWKVGYIEAVVIEFGLRILERLVHELVAELSGVPMQNLGILLMEYNNINM
ncbi:hypothetical protein AQUCO_00400376v1 [Aquilegia coerulea]|uniref:DUF3741 domain-containing protein n=1 Tax=Aquilegia coerulea TaxID=218851 RepID=A0A2G5EUS4_AQUCA|nr:hypothetical protein AQUCO_00400376v1 [Aquilegia coerulea]